MHPHLFDHLSAANAFIGLAVGVGILTGVRRLRAAGLDWRRCLWLELILSVAGLIGAKLYAIVERGHLLPLADELTGSLRYPGGLLAAAGVLVVAHRSLLRGVSLPALADAVAPPTAWAVAVARLGCFAYGCCFGIETTLPWGVTFPPNSPAWQAHVAGREIVTAAASSLPVHPLQLYLASASAVVAAFVTWYGRHATYAGQAALVFVVLDGLSKGLLETLRGEPQPSLQIAALGTAVLAACVLMVWVVRRHGALGGTFRAQGAPIPEASGRSGASGRPEVRR